MSNCVYFHTFMVHVCVLFKFISAAPIFVSVFCVYLTVELLLEGVLFSAVFFSIFAILIMASKKIIIVFYVSFM